MLHPDTIAAIATPIGEGGLAVIRLSGPDAIAVADRCFAGGGRRPVQLAAVPSHTLHYGHLVQEGAVIDEVLAAVMRAPRTFTREDVVEISCHGGVFVAKKALDALLAAGARPAEPGEFTKRAFLNGRIDLAQAEAVADLIHARTELALAAANQQLAGKLSQHIHRIRDDLMGVLAHIEAHLDFPDEDIAPDTRQQLTERIRGALEAMDTLLRTAREGQVLRRGIRAAIIGRPNAGKSSLLNQLLGHDRAIVSPTPGTTRDTIEETANIRGLPVVLVDTAGLREADDHLELEGIRRSHAALEQADLVIHVIDGSEPLNPGDAEHLGRLAGKPRVIVRNKRDLPARLHLPDSVTEQVVAVCSLTGDGLEELKDRIHRLVWSGRSAGEIGEVAISSRHQEALRRAREAVARSQEGLSAGLSLEFVALDLRIATGAVGEIVGKTTTEDLLDSIFHTFCLGK